MGGGQLETRDWEPPASAAGAEDDLVTFQAQPALGFDRVRIDEARGAGVFMDRYARAVQVVAPKRMCAHILNDIVHTREQPGIFKYRLAYGDAVLT